VRDKKLYLKWGNIKGWKGLESHDIKILNEFFEKGRPDSAMLDKTDESDKEILSRFISQFDGEIWNDWTDEKMTKEKAIEYILNYE
jgi:hypothetical protein